MNEKARLQELIKYKILDTSPEKELDELAEIASAICNTPISLVSFLDEKRLWVKAKKGLDVTEAPREVAFCQHTLHSSQEVLVIEDFLQDDRFKDNPLVHGDPYIRFYAGAPLKTPSGHVLGTLCIMDNKPREISESQKNALKLLAKKVMDYLETRKLLLEQDGEIESSAIRLKKLSDQAPGAIYQLEMKPDGSLYFPFISKGFTDIHPDLDPVELKEDAAIAFSVVHPEDLEAVKASLFASFETLNTWSIEYRTISGDGKVSWHWANANPERKEDGTVVWYGTFQDVTARKEYINALEQIVFDISHVIRKPVATMLGLTAVIEGYTLDQETLRKYAGHIKTVSEEMDEYIKKLNEAYSERRLKVAGQQFSF
ncbi:GAF domain-containing protein [Pontibacter harenae]|uniref:GAF domain-containing protein n=1 Tax=Pontibacter harenae TaxID=2894083 RepID=UPI001E33CE7B|nr:GAF domain-containing protein [Pontibacter harenae]MCC9168753.1 PAS domain-containing protein [Pontibacter harenae]